jgi:hypothetical protein
MRKWISWDIVEQIFIFRTINIVGTWAISCPSGQKSGRKLTKILTQQILMAILQDDSEQRRTVCQYARAAAQKNRPGKAGRRCDTDVA